MVIKHIDATKNEDMYQESKPYQIGYDAGAMDMAREIEATNKYDVGYDEGYQDAIEDFLQAIKERVDGVDGMYRHYFPSYRKILKEAAGIAEKLKDQI